LGVASYFGFASGYGLLCSFILIVLDFLEFSLAGPFLTLFLFYFSFTSLFVNSFSTKEKKNKSS